MARGREGRAEVEVGVARAHSGDCEGWMRQDKGTSQERLCDIAPVHAHNWGWVAVG